MIFLHNLPTFLLVKKKRLWHVASLTSLYDCRYKCSVKNLLRLVAVSRELVVCRFLMSKNFASLCLISLHIVTPYGAAIVMFSASLLFFRSVFRYFQLGAFPDLRCPVCLPFPFPGRIGPQCLEQTGPREVSVSHIMEVDFNFSCLIGDLFA